MKLHPLVTSEPVAHWPANFKLACETVLVKPRSYEAWDEQQMGKQIVWPKGSCKKCEKAAGEGRFYYCLTEGETP